MRKVINLKELGKSIPYANFKMERLFLLKEIRLPGDLMYKIYLTDAYFAVPLAKIFKNM